ncbi:hypothetical protein SAMN05421868_13648 [Paenibacillus naphthalenovorans]|nr:hypothetical protein SAMN05421868_13648 [Paenibacillus naphthalenovorans]
MHMKMISSLVSIQFSGRKRKAIVQITNVGFF